MTRATYLRLHWRSLLVSRELRALPLEIEVALVLHKAERQRGGVVLYSQNGLRYNNR